METLLEPAAPLAAAVRKPRVAFLGVGWIGRHRMGALVNAGAVEVCGIADPDAGCLEKAIEAAPGALPVSGFDELLDLAPDGVVIATPSAQHAAQAIQALERGVAVFCQKPLGRTEAEVSAVVAAAKASHRLLGVDLSYRFTEGMQAIRERLAAGEIGKVFAADLVFHNAYGPDKPWFYDPAQAGGGCVMDLGVHLADLALWSLDFPAVMEVASVLRAGGRPATPDVVEDYATAQIQLAGDVSVRLACSWRLHAGREAEISARFFGTDGALEFCNVGGSFYDFEAWRCQGTGRQPIAGPPDDWGGRAALDWAHRLARSSAYDPSCEQLIDVARVLDRIYGR